MTGRVSTDNVNLMRRLIFPVALATGLTSPALAQVVPGRDLLDFPIGALAEAPVLARLGGSGLWNPAIAVLDPDVRVRASVAALAAPQDQGVSLQLLSVSGRLPRGASVELSVVRASVNDLVRTETDPQSIGNEISYATTLLSLGVAQRRGPFALGLALRRRSGEIDGQGDATVGLDAGAIADGLGGRDIRVAASTFLWRPGNSRPERPTYTVGADMRIGGTNRLRELRGGASLAIAAGGTAEQYLFATGRRGRWEAQAGGARYRGFSDAQWQPRLGIGLHYARYIIGLSREESGAGLDPLYQVMIGSVFR